MKSPFLFYSASLIFKLLFDKLLFILADTIIKTLDKNCVI